MKIKILFVCLIASTLFNGCKKDEETTTPTPATPSAKTDLLCGKNWMLTAFTINPAFNYFGTGLVTDIMGSMQPCQLNNLTVYSTNLSYLVDEGPSVCTGGAPQTFETGSWAFASSETHLVMTKSGGIPTDFTIATLTATSLQLTMPYIVSGTTYTITSTYTKQ